MAREPVGMEFLAALNARQVSERAMEGAHAADPVRPAAPAARRRSRDGRERRFAFARLSKWSSIRVRA